MILSLGMDKILLALFTLAEIEHGIPSGLLAAVCWVESNHKPSAINLHDGHGHSRGICQLKLVTARYMGWDGKPRDLFDPSLNIELAARYLKHQHGKAGNWGDAIVAYNVGRVIRKRTPYFFKVMKAWGTEPYVENSRGNGSRFRAAYEAFRGRAYRPRLPGFSQRVSLARAEYVSASQTTGSGGRGRAPRQRKDGVVSAVCPKYIPPKRADAFV